MQNLNWIYSVGIVLILLFCLVTWRCCSLYYSFTSSSSSLFNFQESVPGSNHRLLPLWYLCFLLSDSLRNRSSSEHFNRNAKGSKSTLMTQCIENQSGYIKKNFRACPQKAFETPPEIWLIFKSETVTVVSRSRSPFYILRALLCISFWGTTRSKNLPACLFYWARGWEDENKQVKTGVLFSPKSLLNVFFLDWMDSSLLFHFIQGSIHSQNLTFC